MQVEVHVLCQPTVGLFLRCERTGLREPLGEDSNGGAVGKPTTSSVPSPLARIAQPQPEHTQVGTGTQDTGSTRQLTSSCEAQSCVLCQSRIGRLSQTVAVM